MASGAVYPRQGSLTSPGCRPATVVLLVLHYQTLFLLVVAPSCCLLYYCLAQSPAPHACCLHWPRAAQVLFLQLHPQQYCLLQ
jgi:hypothetical protein